MLRRTCLLTIVAIAVVVPPPNEIARADDGSVDHGTSWLVSTSTKGGSGNGRSIQASIDNDGRRVAFASRASDLVRGDRRRGRDVFLYDHARGDTTVVSRTASGGFLNGRSSRPDLSGSGQWLTYVSQASNVVPGDDNGRADVFLVDLRAGTTTLVSKARKGGGSGKRASTQAVVDNHGHRVAFCSVAGDLARRDHNRTSDIFVFNRRSGRTTMVSRGLDGFSSNGRSGEPAISGNGRYVAYTSVATNLVEGATSRRGDVYVFDRRTGTNSLVSQASGGGPGNNTSRAPSISRNGRYVAFASFASDLVAGDGNGTWDVFLRDRVTGMTTLVSHSPGGSAGNSGSFYPSIDSHGVNVAFASDATNLGPVDGNQRRDVYVANMATGRITLQSKTPDGQSGNASSTHPALSGDASYVAFESAASDLARPDHNETWDVFLRRRG
jgi:Tol biopolymer transport system component